MQYNKTRGNEKPIETTEVLSTRLYCVTLADARAKSGIYRRLSHPHVTQCVTHWKMQQLTANVKASRWRNPRSICRKVLVDTVAEISVGGVDSEAEGNMLNAL